MAILKQVEGEYEVRIMRQPENTYFDEYVKVDSREKHYAIERKRYIEAEEGALFSIEVTLKPGFDFSNLDRVQAQLCFPGQADIVSWVDIKKPITLYRNRTAVSLTGRMNHADITLNGQRILGAQFAFRKLDIDEDLNSEVDLMGVSPENLGCFVVKLWTMKWLSRQLAAAYANTQQDKEMAALVSKDPLKDIASPKTSVTRDLWSARKIDAGSLKKNGITYSAGLFGGKPEPLSGNQNEQRSFTPSSISSTPEPDVPQVKNPGMVGHCRYFYFYPRTAEFLEQNKIIKFPPPLYVFDWEDLKKYERQHALKELQTINQRYRNAGPSGKLERVKWRSWNKLYAPEQKAAFYKSKNENIVYESGGDQQQIEPDRLKIISIPDDDESDVSGSEESNDDLPNAMKKERTLSQSPSPYIKSEDNKSSSSSIKKEVKKEVKKESKIKAEGFDLLDESDSEALPVKPVKHEMAEGRIKREVKPENDNASPSSKKYFNAKPEIIEILDSDDESPDYKRMKLEKMGGCSKLSSYDDKSELERKRARVRLLEQEIQQKSEIAKNLAELRELYEGIDRVERIKKESSMKEELEISDVKSELKE